MADEKKKARPKLTSPKGVFKWPKLSEPDYGSKDYPCPEGKYETKLVLKASDKETKAFIKALQPAYAEAMAEAREQFSQLKAETRKKLKAVTENPLFTELLDQETEQPTGEIEFKFGMKASGEIKKGPKAGKKWQREPVIYDAKGKRMFKVPTIYGGTVGRVAFDVSPYFIPATGAAGLKLGLIGVQIIDLVSAGGQTADQLGFGVEEGGYSHEEPADEPAKNDADAESDGESPDDGSSDF